MLTKKRKEILKIIEDNKKPISADSIMSKIKDADMNLSTIYRGLDYLFKNSYITKTNINKVVHYYIKKDPHNHFIVCIKCNKMEEIPCTIKVDNFKLVEHDLIAYGYCNECIDK